MPPHALSDWLPAAISEKRRSYWLAPSANFDPIRQARDSIDRSARAEALLGASSAKVLLHIGGNEALRAFQFAKSDVDRHAIVYHPLAEARDETTALIEQEPCGRVVCIDDLSRFDGVPSRCSAFPLSRCMPGR